VHFRKDIFLTAALFLLLASGCNVLRRVPPNKNLLVKNKIVVDEKDIDVDEMYTYVKQKPNRRVLDFLGSRGYPLYLHIYNQVDSAKQAKRREKSQERFDRRKEKITAKNLQIAEENKTRPKNRQKKVKELPAKPRRRLPEALSDWLLDIGEPPVIHDTDLMKRTVRQLSMYLNNKGYFNNKVWDSTVFVQKPLNRLRTKLSSKAEKKFKRKAIVFYKVKAGTPYKIRNIKYNIEDELVGYFVFNDTTDALIRSGENYDVDHLQQERERITYNLKNNGYFFFTRDFIRYSADSALNSHQMDITIDIRKQYFLQPDSSIVKADHVRYYIRNVIVITDYMPGEKSDQVKRNIVRPSASDSVFLLSRGRLAFRPSVLTERIAFRQGELYQETEYEKTYRDLVNLRNFKQVGIEMKQSIGGRPDQLDCIIRLLPTKRQAYTTQVEGTNTGGNLGISGSFTYQNNNMFRGAEVLEFKIRAGTEAQRLVTNITGEQGDEQLTFNTIEFGPEMRVTFPRAFFPFNILPEQIPFRYVRKPERIDNRRTVLQASFNYQRRVDYTRTIGNLGYGYNVRLDKIHRFALYPFEINLVDAVLSQTLFQQLVENRDLLMLYRFTDHLTNAGRFSYELNTDPNARLNDLGSQYKSGKDKDRNVFYLKVDLENSGGLLYAIYKRSDAQPDANGSYRIAGIPFSHYARFAVDARFYRNFGLKPGKQVVFRLAGGAGFPKTNFRTLPLEKSFFGGGANGMRAWESRSLGPGSYNVPVELKYVQFGDIHIEHNSELRFRITKTLNGALFYDVGNVWLIDEDTTRPGGQFVSKDFQFVKDLAVGAGVGLRFDLSFFILRLDAAVPLRDPAFTEGNRWLLSNDGALRRTNFNFGIGYPF